MAVLVYAYLSLIRHWHFTSNGYDLGIFDQAMWKYSQFLSPEITVHGKHILGEHFHPILILFTPLYWVTPRAEVLLVIQALALSLAAFPVYFFAKSRLGRLPAIFAACAYLSFWGVQVTNNYDFHEVSLTVPLIAWAIYTIDTKRWNHYYIATTFLLLCKENMSVLLIGMGVYLAVVKEWRHALVSIVGGVFWFALTIGVVIPYFAGESYEFWKYSKLGDGPAAAIQTLVTKPLYTLQVLVDAPVKRETLALLGVPFLFLFIASPILLIALPLVLERFLSDIENLWGASYHYNATIAPILAMGAVDGISRLARYIRYRQVREYVVLGTTVSFVIVSFFLTISRELPLLAYARAEKLQLFSLREGDKIGRAAISLIPRGASVSAQDPIIPHISGRKEVYALKLSLPTDFYIRGGSLNTWPLPGEAEIDTIFATREAEGYVRIFDQAGWVVLKKQ